MRHSAQRNLRLAPGLNGLTPLRGTAHNYAAYAALAALLRIAFYKATTPDYTGLNGLVQANWAANTNPEHFGLPALHGTMRATPGYVGYIGLFGLKRQSHLRAPLAHIYAHTHTHRI